MKGFMMFEYFAVLTSQNELCLQDIKNECIQESWVPLCSKVDIQTGESSILFFKSLDTARNFIKRNFSRDELVGVIMIQHDQFDVLKNANVNIQVLEWPQNFKNSSQYKLAIEVVNLLESPELNLLYEKI